jgi:hypothetical protein
MEFQRLIDGDQRMKTIGPGRANAEAQIDFCVRTNGCRHTGSL